MDIDESLELLKARKLKMQTLELRTHGEAQKAKRNLVFKKKYIYY